MLFGRLTQIVRLTASTYVGHIESDLMARSWHTAHGSFTSVERQLTKEGEVTAKFWFFTCSVIYNSDLFKCFLTLAQIFNFKNYFSCLCSMKYYVDEASRFSDNSDIFKVCGAIYNFWRLLEFCNTLTFMCQLPNTPPSWCSYPRKSCYLARGF